MILTNFLCDKNEHFTSGEYLTSEYFDSLYEEALDSEKSLSHPAILFFFSEPNDPDMDFTTCHLLIKCDEGVVVDVSMSEGEKEEVKINTFIEGEWQKDIERLYRELFYDTLIIPFFLWENLVLD